MRRATLLATLVLAWAAPAHGDKRAAKKAFLEGQERYLAGDFLGAALSFETAYENDRDPVYLFNIGQAYRRRAELRNSRADCARAAKAYREFLADAPGVSNRREIETYIGEMTACAGTAPPDPAPDLPATPPEPPPEEPRPDRDATTTTSPPAAPNPPAPEGRDRRQTIGLVIGIGGLAALATGVYFGLDARSAQDERDSTTDGARARELDVRGARSEKLAIGSFVVGGAALIGGATLYMLGRSARREQTITVAPARRGAYVQATFSF